MLAPGALPLASKQIANKALFSGILIGIEESGKMGNPKPQQIGRDGVTLVVGHDVLDSACLPKILNVGAGHIEFSGDSTGDGQFV